MAEAIKLALEYNTGDDRVPAGATQCGRAKEGMPITLRCAGYDSISKIEFASYGMPTGNCRGNFDENNFEVDTECHSERSIPVVEQHCLGKSWCEVTALNNDFKDPCYGKGKQLAVAVTCTEGKKALQLPEGVDEDPAKRAALPPLPRVTSRQLQQRPDLLRGDKPFALLGGTRDWSAMTNWSLPYFQKMFPENPMSDYFFTGKQQNKDVGRLVPFDKAIADFEQAKGTDRTPYFLWYVPLAKWRTFEGDAMPIHKWLFNQEGALEECLGEEGLASVFAVPPRGWSAPLGAVSGWCTHVYTIDGGRGA
jgi:hypothetical protein